MKKMVSFAVAALVLCVAFGCGKEEKPAPTTPATPSEAVVETVDDPVAGYPGQVNKKQDPKQNIQKQDPKPTPKPNIQKQDDVNVNVIQGEEP